MLTWDYPFLVLATRNENKKKQIADLFLSEMNIQVKGLRDLPDMPDIIEDQDTFEGNARKKAEVISIQLGVPVLSDDSGLEVVALDGRPGVYSARYAGEGADDHKNNMKLIKELALIPEFDRQAKFISVMAMAIPGEETHFFRGEVGGVILKELRGSGGFGYQPLFYIPSEGKSMAELTDSRRNEIGHRALATRSVMSFLKKKYRFG